MKKIIMIALGLNLLTACAGLTPPFLISEDSKQYQDAKACFEQGKYLDAREAYRTLADSRSPWAEQSKFNAAYVLVYYKNPDKNHALAGREFEEFLSRYPKSRLVNEANTWLAMLKMFEQTKAGELANEVATLTLHVQRATKDLQKAHGDVETLMHEKNALQAEKISLTKSVGDLLEEKEALIKKQDALVKDSTGLQKDKTILAKKVAKLNRETKRLIREKVRLEKSLRDLTLVDVKMERKRKRIQQDEKK